MDDGVSQLASRVAFVTSFTVACCTCFVQAVDLSGLDVGMLTFAAGVPCLTIGPHILEGKAVKLVPPLLILQRGDTGEVVIDEKAPSGVGYTVAGLCHEKLLFKERPKLGLKR